MFQRSEETLELSPAATTADVVQHYRCSAGSRGSFMDSIAVAVNQQYANRPENLRDGDEVALLPPVSGGAAPGLPARNCRCEIVRERIPTERILEEIKQGEDGAVVVFEGVVRNNTRSRPTRFLDYEAYEPMAVAEMNELARKAVSSYRAREVVIVHRLGRLAIGETSVLIVVASAHRAAAFDACRFLIDTLKRTVPIWKKEHFADGAVWADGEPFPEELQAGKPERLGG